MGGLAHGRRMMGWTDERTARQDQPLAPGGCGVRGKARREQRDWAKLRKLNLKTCGATRRRVRATHEKDSFYADTRFKSNFTLWTDSQ
ncbi:hypothetical protein EVAR_23736_1 [Eumeta japonica]|uniref:Uncharacterized protein n=1 Tax=Eumeta variegata TaxID=151549 RepID=A0A4C1VHC3_EUMVA|nr:hypothetical protein EVAR_23736_1 [Eumeta japonica]